MANLTLGSLDLNDGTNYELREEWRPRVAARRPGTMGGRSLYEDVIEEIPIKVFGTTASNALSALHDITVELDKAQRWYNGEDITAITLDWNPTGATGSDLQAIVKGPAPGADLMSLQPQFDLSLQSFVILVDLSIWRGGTWLKGTDAGSGGAAVEMINTFTVSSLTATDLPSPTDFTISIGSSTFQLEDDAYVLAADGTNGFQIIEAEDLAGTNANYASQTSTNDASSDAFVRYTPPDTTEQSINDTSISWTDVQRIAVFAVVRNNSSTVSFQVRASVNTTTSAKTFYTRKTVVDISSTNPRVFFIGLINLPSEQTVNRFDFYATAETTTGSPTLDVDAFVLQEVLETSTAVLIKGETDSTADYTRITVFHREESHITPRVSFRDAGTDITDKSYQGNAYYLSKATSFQIVMMATSGSSWRLDKSGGSDFNYTATATRYPLYLVPPS